MKRFNLTVLPGDGIGPEVIEQGVKVLNAVAERYDCYFEYCYGDIGAVSIEKHGNPLPDLTLEAARRSDAVFLGAIGDPKYDNNPHSSLRPEQGLLRLRKELALFANIRPVQAYPGLEALSPIKPEHLEGTDMIIYRELTGGIYFGERGRSADGQSAYDTCSYHRSEIERIGHLAFKRALQRRKKVTLVDKANVLDSSRLWRETITELAEGYPEVELHCMFVDNAAMQLIVAPGQFDILLTSNMFGDILSDEASVLTGSLGMLPSASIGASTPLFEPVHGSYPQAAGKDIANPIATILSAAMMLDHLGILEGGQAVRKAVERILQAGVGTEDLRPNISCSCSQLGDLITSAILEGEDFQVKEQQLQQGVSTII